MKNKVTVIPSDNIIIVDEFPLIFKFHIPENIHAIQWKNGSGHVEFTDGNSNKILATGDYLTIVSPYVEAWETEKLRLDEEAKKPPTIDDRIRFIKYELELVDQESIRPLRASIDGTATDADVQRLKELEDKARGLRKQLAELSSSAG